VAAEHYDNCALVTSRFCDRVDDLQEIARDENVGK
jgi:hypothetical protein